MNSILVLNCGSSSIKFTVFRVEGFTVLARGLIEGVGSGHAKAIIKVDSGTEEREFKKISYQESLVFIDQWLNDNQELAGDIAGVGHRVVHGGSFFDQAQKITGTIKDKIRELFSLAPLHNRVNLEGIDFFEIRYPLKQVAVFDTAFHQTIPKEAYLYGIDQEYCKRDQVRRYGFHGTSHHFVAEQMAKVLNRPLEKCSMITLHLGNGCSACAINRGKSVDTSMGFTPLEGLIMGTRSGSLDPGILAYLCEGRGYSIEEMLTILNKKSGLLGISGLSHDMRDLESAYETNEAAKLAIDMFCYQIVKTTASYMPLLESFDALVFTGGIGENSPFIRQKVLSKLAKFNLICNEEKNNGKGQRLITNSSEPGAYVIHTNEELSIAKEVLKILL
jgi:acetate kinase